MPVISSRGAVDAARVGSRPLSAVGWWVLFGTLCNVAGWGLSALHLLNARGYGVVFILALVALVIFREYLLPASPMALVRPLTKLRHRFRRPLPFGFAVLAGLASLGGLLYHPGNPDGLTQRIPRLLTWLAEGRWHWMEHSATSYNSHACGFEWLMAPMFVFLGTDRWVFLYNVMAYLLLPGLVFSTLHRLGVRPRVASSWMWVAPAGLCFAMQAGSIANDMAGAVLALAAVDFALRANRSGRYAEVCLSILAASLLSGMKTSNLPLGLPWLIALWPSAGRLLRRPLASAAVLVTAVMASLLPIIGLNLTHGTSWCGDYRGTEGNITAGPLIAIIGSGLNLVVENILPPVFPLAGWWNTHFYKFLPAPLLARLEQGFEPGAAHLAMKEMQFEIGAGISCGLSWLVLVSCIWAWRSGARAALPGRRDGPKPIWGWHQVLVRWSPYVALLVFMSQMVVSGPARLVTPYYCLLLPALLASAGHASLVRLRIWQIAAIATVALAALMLVLNPPRPLWPAQTVLSHLVAQHPGSRPLNQGAMLYRAYADRWDALAAIRDRIPAQVKQVGLITYMAGSSFETSLWRPFGQRRVWRLPRGVDRAELDRKGVSFVVVGTDAAIQNPALNFKTDFDRWLHACDGVIVAQASITILATSDPMPWYLVQIGARAR